MTGNISDNNILSHSLGQNRRVSSSKLMPRSSYTRS